MGSRTNSRQHSRSVRPDSTGACWYGIIIKTTDSGAEAPLRSYPKGRLTIRFILAMVEPLRVCIPYGAVGRRSLVLGSAGVKRLYAH